MSSLWVADGTIVLPWTFSTRVLVPLLPRRSSSSCVETLRATLATPQPASSWQRSSSCGSSGSTGSRRGSSAVVAYLWRKMPSSNRPLLPSLLCAVSLAVLSVVAPRPLSAQAASTNPRGWERDDQEKADPTFGYIRSVALDGLGRTYVLDEGQRALLAFSEQGELIGRVGRSGFGPGEFSAPTTVVVDHHDRVLVLDSRQRRISEFGWRGGRLVHVRDHRLGGDAYQACLRGDSLFTVGRGNEDIISVYVRGGGGAYLRAASFGTLQSGHPGFSNPIVRALRADALLVCQESSGTLFTVSIQMGEFQRFEGLQGPGSLATIEGFAGIEMVIHGSSVENRLPRTGVADATRAAILTKQGTLLLAIGELEGAAAGRNVFRAFRITETDLRGKTLAQARSEWVIGYVVGDRVACYRNDPAPAVRVLSGLAPSVTACNTKPSQ
jgi:6-bladed beta-propeller protein